LRLLAGLVALPGLAIAAGILRLFAAAKIDIPHGGIVLAPRTVVIALLVGVVVTLLSALVPALRATRVSPVAALSEGAQLPLSHFSRLSTPAAVGVALLGGAALAAGIAGSAATTTRLLEMGLGAVLLFVSLAMLAKYLVRPLAMLIGRPLQALAPTSGRLARENAARNPQRTGATAAALMIGLALVVFVAVFAQGLKTSFVDALARSNRANVVVSDDSMMMGLSSKGARVVRSLPDVRAATGIAMASMKVDGGVTMVNAIEPRLFPAVWHLTWVKGGDPLLARLGANEAIVEEQYAKGHHLTVGSRIAAVAQSGEVHGICQAGVADLLGRCHCRTVRLVGNRRNMDRRAISSGDGAGLFDRDGSCHWRQSLLPCPPVLVNF